MEIKAITVNAAVMAPERNVQGNRSEEKTEGSLFGPECRVTISREGKKLSRQREEDEYYEKAKNRYLEELSEIDDMINALNASYEKKKDMAETIERQQEVLRAMNKQKQYQMEENQRREKEAQQTAAVQSGKYQEEIDENNREIKTLLKTIKEAEKAADQRENGRSEDDGSGGDGGTKNSAGDVIRNSAGQFAASSIRREQDVEKMIAGLNEEGHRYLDMADSITRAVLEENERVRRALGQEDITLEEMEELMMPLRERITSGIYVEVANYRGWGLQILQDALDCKLQHIADDPLRGMEEAKESMMRSAEDAVFRGAMQGKLSEASGRLEEEVKELIDERNRIDGVRSTEEEEKKEVKEEEKEEKQAEDVEDFIKNRNVGSENSR